MLSWFRRSATRGHAAPADTAAYRLRSWPELPDEYRTAPVLQAFTRMTLGPLTLGLFASKSGMPLQEANSLLEHLVRRGPVEKIPMGSSGAHEQARSARLPEPPRI